MRLTITASLAGLMLALALALSAPALAQEQQAKELPAEGALSRETPKVQGGYSTKPLERPVFDVEETVVRVMLFNEWLIHNHSSLDADSMCGSREHLFSLIDSRVKHLYASEQVVLPRDHGALLTTLFSWAERLGVFGGHLVYNEVKPDDWPEQPPLMSMPDGFDLSLQDDMFVVTSKDWTFTVPYYFMIWNMNDFDAAGGPHTQMVVLSTGAATHEGQEGHSQATLMFLYGPGAEGPEFARYWADLHGFTGKEPESTAPNQPRTTRKLYDEARNLRVEYATWKGPKGQFLVVYSGVEGTYQWNRPHFLDFLRAIREQ